MINMQSLIPDLRKLTEFYFGIESEISTALQNSGANSEKSLPDTILKDRTWMVQIERMNAHIMQLSEDLKRFRNDADPETRRTADNLVSEVKTSAIRIRDLCAEASKEIEKKKSVLKKELGNIGKGKQYLKSSDPVKNNYPKFIDSTG